MLCLLNSFVCFSVSDVSAISAISKQPSTGTWALLWLQLMWLNKLNAKALKYLVDTPLTELNNLLVITKVSKLT